MKDLVVTLITMSFAAAGFYVDSLPLVILAALTGYAADGYNPRPAQLRGDDTLF